MWILSQCASKWIWDSCRMFAPGYPLWWLAQSCRCLQAVCTGHCRVGSARSPASLATESQRRTSLARSRAWRFHRETCTAVWARPNRPDRPERKESRGTFSCPSDTVSGPAGSKTTLAAILRSWFRVRAGSGGASPCTLYRGKAGDLQGLPCSCSSCRIVHAGRSYTVRGLLAGRALLSPTAPPRSESKLSCCLVYVKVSGFGRSFCQWQASTVTGGFLPGMSGRSLYNMRKDLFFIRHIWFSSYQVNHVDKFVFSVKDLPPPREILTPLGRRGIFDF